MVGEAANALASSSEMFSSRPMQLIFSGEFWVELCSIQTPNLDILDFIAIFLDVVGKGLRPRVIPAGEIMLSPECTSCTLISEEWHLVE